MRTTAGLAEPQCTVRCQESCKESRPQRKNDGMLNSGLTLCQCFRLMSPFRVPQRQPRRRSFRYAHFTAEDTGSAGRGEQRHTAHPPLALACRPGAPAQPLGGRARGGLSTASLPQVPARPVPGAAEPLARGAAAAPLLLADAVRERGREHAAPAGDLPAQRAAARAAAQPPGAARRRARPAAR